MIRKMRRRLVVVSIGSLLIVLLLIMGTVNILNYQQILRDADQILGILKENEGRFPLREPGMSRQNFLLNHVIFRFCSLSMVR